MSGGYAKWGDVKAKGRASDPRTGEERAAGRAAARERREAYVRGHQLAEMRTTAGVTQAELATALGVADAPAQWFIPCRRGLAATMSSRSPLSPCSARASA